MKLVVFLVCSALLYASDAKQYLCDSTAKCGCSQKPALLSKIAGGNTGNEGYWGWVVSIKHGSYFSCGGSILSSSWILTTASCVADTPRDNITVAAGSNNIRNSTQTRSVTATIIHPEYNRSSLINDIALIRLETPLKMDDPTVAQLCLPSQTSANYPPDNSSVVAVGWGAATGLGVVNIDATNYGTLREISAKAVPDDNEECQSLINNSSAQLCASVIDSNEDACAGDAGNPLMIYTSSRQWAIVGLVSYGIGCLGTYPSVYTRISTYLDWIKSMNVTDAITVNAR